jgi:hypothetical protein
VTEVWQKEIRETSVQLVLRMTIIDYDSNCLSAINSPQKWVELNTNFAKKCEFSQENKKHYSANEADVIAS